MEGLEGKMGLVKANEKETEIAIMNSPFKTLAERGHHLYFGKPYGSFRSQYWKEPQGEKYSFDYHRLAQGVVELMQDLTKPLDEIISNKTFSLEGQKKVELKANIKNLIESLNESMEMYNSEQIDRYAKTLGIKNNDIYLQLLLLNIKARELEIALIDLEAEKGFSRYALRESASSKTEQFVEKAREFVKFCSRDILQIPEDYDKGSFH